MAVVPHPDPGWRGPVFLPDLTQPSSRLPTPLRYPDIRIDGVSFLLPPDLHPRIWNPNLFRCCSSPSDGSIRLVLLLALLNPG
jgi:hypothetical protein